ncbi:hypothetical protein [Streptomyces sp. FB2]|uniref:hypothetical protein n=1 Tax=Streptomyces sp. FB2 TaxID=2902454 RepID=UPI0027E4426F|nr:hypothetical protein [Streptomyces sp. FB2]
MTDGVRWWASRDARRTEAGGHARAEERYESTHIRRSADPGQLATMAEAAESMAPTRPYLGAANMALGPVAALMDRTRDTVRKAMGEGG